MKLAPSRGPGPPDQPLRALPGRGLPLWTLVPWNPFLGLTLPTCVMQGESLYIHFHFFICKT